MKRVRGLDDVASPSAKHSSVSAASGLGGGGGSLDYHTSSGIGVVVPGQAVRSVTSKEMPASIQFGSSTTIHWSNCCANRSTISHQGKVCDDNDDDDNDNDNNNNK